MAFNNNNNSSLLQFHPDILFTQEKESVANLVVKKENRIPVSKLPTGASVYTLFKYLETSSVSRFMPSLKDIIDNVKLRCKNLVPDIERRKKHITNMMRSFVRYLILIMLTVDERGDRMSEILSTLNSLYFEYDDILVENGKNNYKHVDHLYALICQTYDESIDMNTDTFYIKCSAEKNLGRTPIAVKNNPPHQLNRVKEKYIKPAKTNPPVKYDEEDGEFFMDRPGPMSPNNNTQREVDYYPVFLKILSVFRDIIPLPTNHGWFTQSLNKAVRKLNYQDWPMYGLVNSLLNMEGLIDKRRIKLTLSNQNKTYYCCYSGLPLVQGEEVWLIRILVYSSERYKLWAKEGKIPAEPHKSNLLKSNIKNYLMKTSICATQSLFYSDFTEDYKNMYPEHFGLKSKITGPQRSLPMNRTHQYNTLWYTLNRLIYFIEENHMHAMLFHNKESMRTFAQRLSPQILVLDEEHNFEENLLRFILQAIYGVSEIEDLPAIVKNDRKILDSYLSQMLSIIIDFVDLMFDYITVPVIASTVVESTKKFFFNLPELGIIENDENLDKIFVVKPQLRIPFENDGLLKNLFNLSEKRKEQLNGLFFMNMKRIEIDARLYRLQLAIKTHPFFFMLFFSRLYLSHTLLPKMNFMEANKIFCSLSIVLNNQ